MRVVLVIILTVSYMVSPNWAENSGIFKDNILSSARYLLIFEKWVTDFNMDITEEDLERRMSVFADNFDFIAAHNFAGDTTYTLGLNEYAHLTAPEFKELMGFKYMKSTTTQQGSTTHDTEKVHGDDNWQLFNDYGSAYRRAEELPDELDWRTNGAVTYVKDQKRCGSCWSFSTLGSLEGAYLIKYEHEDDPISFSAQQLVDCDDVDLGCDGGNIATAFDWVNKHGGVCSEEDYPYMGSSGECKDCNTVQGSKVKTYVTADATDVGLMSALTKCPVSVAIKADMVTFQLYKAGVYSSSQCEDTETMELDHAVLVVGYGTSELHNEDFWIVKNSWGNKWGKDGYVLMRRSDESKYGVCGILREAMYPVLEE